MLIKKFQLVGGSEGSGELKNKLLNKCWKKSFNLLVVVRVVGNWKINYWINFEKKKFQLVGGSEGSLKKMKKMLIYRFWKVGGSEGSGKLKNKLLNKCW